MSTKPKSTTKEKPMSKAKNIELIPIKNIITNKGTQPRASLSQHAIKDYSADQAEAVATYNAKCVEKKETSSDEEFLLHHNPLPPGLAYRTPEGKVYLVEGFHRIDATLNNNFGEFPVEVTEGTLDEAIKHAAGSNAQHGERRSKADKKRAVEMIFGLKDCKELSDNDIAKLCKVSPGFVARNRPVVKTSTKSRGRPKKDGTPAKAKKGKKAVNDAPETSEDAREGASGDLDAETSQNESETPTGGNGATAPAISDELDRAAMRIKSVIGGEEGASFYAGITDGSLGMSKNELKSFAELKDGQIQRVAPLVIQSRMPVKKALDFTFDALSDKTKEELTNRCIAHGGKFRLDFEGYKLEITKV